MSNSKKAGPPVYMHAAKEGLSFGVLRREFSGTNDVVSFVHRKLHPDKSVSASPGDLRWNPTCARHEVLLAATMPDILRHFPVLLRSFECEADPTLKSLMLHFKVTSEEGGALHRLFDRARTFAAQVLRDQHGLAAILALHDPPHSAAFKSLPHVHIMALSRRFDGRRWDDVTDLACDAANEQLAEAWKAIA